jgi:hypothetical protein
MRKNHLQSLMMNRFFTLTLTDVYERDDGGKMQEPEILPVSTRDIRDVFPSVSVFFFQYLKE